MSNQMRTLKIWIIVTALLFILGGCSLVETETLEAVFTYSPENPVVGETVTFDASNTTGENLAHDWTVDNAEVTGDALMERTFDEAKSYLVKLTVTDEYGTTETAQVTVTVKQELVDARFTSQPSYRPVKGQYVTFDATGSSLYTLTENSIQDKLQFFWHFDVANMTPPSIDNFDKGAIVEHEFASAGRKAVFLIAIRENLDIGNLLEDINDISGIDISDGLNEDELDILKNTNYRRYGDWEFKFYDVQSQAIEIASFGIEDYEKLYGTVENVSGNELTECVARATFYRGSGDEIESQWLSFHDVSESDPLEPGKYSNFSAICYDCDEDDWPKAKSANIKILYCEYS